MTLIVSNITRPNLETKFFRRQGRVKGLNKLESIKSRYMESGKLISEKRELSDNLLNVKVTEEWSSNDDYQQYLNDISTNDYIVEENKYNDEKGITVTTDVT